MRTVRVRIHNGHVYIEHMPIETELVVYNDDNQCGTAYWRETGQQEESEIPFEARR